MVRINIKTIAILLLFFTCELFSQVESDRLTVYGSPNSTLTRAQIENLLKSVRRDRYHVYEDHSIDSLMIPGSLWRDTEGGYLKYMDFQDSIQKIWILNREGSGSDGVHTHDEYALKKDPLIYGTIHLADFFYNKMATISLVNDEADNDLYGIFDINILGGQNILFNNDTVAMLKDVRNWVTDQHYLTKYWLDGYLFDGLDIVTANGLEARHYATEDWVSFNLDSYATRTWVNDFYVSERLPKMSDTLKLYETTRLWNHRINPNNLYTLDILVNGNGKLRLNTDTVATLKDIRTNLSIYVTQANLDTVKNNRALKNHSHIFSDVTGLKDSLQQIRTLTNTKLNIIDTTNKWQPKGTYLVPNDTINKWSYKNHTHSQADILNLKDTIQQVRTLANTKLNSADTLNKWQPKGTYLVPNDTLNKWQPKIANGETGKVWKMLSSTAQGWGDDLQGSGGEANTATSLGGYYSIVGPKVGTVLGFKSLRAGTGISLGVGSDGNSVEIHATGGGGGGGETNTASNIGQADNAVGIFKEKVGVDLRFKKLSGYGDIVVQELGDIVYVYAPFLVTSASSLGGTSLVGGLVGSDLRFKGLQAGSGISINGSNANYLEISATGGSGGGETNTASNVGSGHGIYKEKVSADLRFKTLVAGSNISIDNSNANQLTISASGGGGGGEVNTITNLGTGYGIYRNKIGTDLKLRSLVAGSNVSIDTNANHITISSTGGGSGLTGSGTASYYVKWGNNNTLTNAGLVEGDFIFSEKTFFANNELRVQGRLIIFPPDGDGTNVYIKANTSGQDIQMSANNIIKTNYYEKPLDTVAMLSDIRNGSNHTHNYAPINSNGQVVSNNGFVTQGQVGAGGSRSITYVTGVTANTTTYDLGINYGKVPLVTGINVTTATATLNFSGGLYISSSGYANIDIKDNDSNLTLEDFQKLENETWKLDPEYLEYLESKEWKKRKLLSTNRRTQSGADRSPSGVE